MTYEDITNKKFPDLMKGQATESRCPTVSKYGKISNKMLPKHTTVKWQKNQDKKKILNTALRKGRTLDLTTDLTTGMTEVSGKTSSIIDANLKFYTQQKYPLRMKAK